MRALALVSLVALCACTSNPRSSENTPLTPAQSAGRALYQQNCASCHHAYSAADLHGPALQGLFRKPYMPSGTPANDDRVRDVILLGRPMMPAFRGALTDNQLNQLLTFLHTL